MVLSRSGTEAFKEYYRAAIERAKELWFSSTGRYLTVFSKRDSRNCVNVIDLTHKILVAPSDQVYEEGFDGVPQKEQFPFIKYIRNDELALFHSKPDEISVLSPSSKFACVQTIAVEPCDYILTSPTNPQGTVHVALITKHNESNDQKRQGKLTIFNYPDLQTPLLSQTFQRAHEIKVEWSPTSSHA